MLRRIITFCLLIAIININGTSNDFCKDKHIILQALCNNSKKTIAAGAVLIIIGLALGQNNKYQTTWTREAVAYSFIVTGLTITKTGYNGYTLTT